MIFKEDGMKKIFIFFIVFFTMSNVYAIDDLWNRAREILGNGLHLRPGKSTFIITITAGNKNESYSGVAEVITLFSLDEDNTEKIFSEVSSIYDDVSKCKSAFVKFENESKNLPTSQVNNLKNQFNSKIKEIKEARTETINEYHSELTQNIQKQKKPITKWFVWGQVFLLIAFWIVYYQKLYATENLGEVFLGLNIVGLICYIIFVIKQFNKYNKAVKEKNDLFIKKEDYYPEKKLIGNIILACIVFAFVQFIFLLAHYHLFESLRSSFSLQLILISAGVYFFIRVFIKKRQK